MDEHTPDNPYCSDPTCWCHTDLEYHGAVMAPFDQVTDEQVEQARDFFGIAA